jgi:hypothetical protein
MRWRLQRALRMLGGIGVLGIGVLVACAGFWLSALVPAQEELSAQRVAHERLRSRTPYRLVATSARAEELRRFYSLFPPVASMTDELEGVHRLARQAGLELAQGEYRLERPAYGLWAYRLVLPVRGGYGEVRQFVAALLRDMPTASLEALRFERKKAADAQLDAQLRITLHLRPSLETTP